MNLYSSPGRPFHLHSCHIAVVLLIVLAVSISACKSSSSLGSIHDAARDGDLQKVTMLLKDSPELALKEDKGALTPLHWAAENGHRDVAELLLANKADVNAKDNNGYTPLSWAAKAGHKDVAELLLANGANVNAIDTMGRTPLHWAAAGNHKDIVDLLLSNRADVNAPDNDHATPLRWAADHKDIVDLLRRNGGRE
jgi:ankyrin repeat protein